MNTKGIFVRFMLLSLGLMAASLRAQAPQLLNYQGKLNQGGNPAMGTVSMTFAIYSTATGGTALWTETRNVAVTNGVFNELLGSVTPFPSGLFTGAGERYLGITVSGAEIGRFRLASAAFAIRAGQADGVADGAVTGSKIAGGQVVKSINSLRDDITLNAGSNVTITPSGNSLTISATGTPLPDGAVTTQKLANDAVTSTKVLDNSLTDADIQDRVVSIFIPALALGSGPNIARASNGLSWPSGFGQAANAVIGFPNDWDGASNFTVTVYFTPETSASGVVSFFIRPVGRSANELMSDPGSVTAAGVSVPANSVSKLFLQSFSVPSSRFSTGHDIFHFFGIQRGGTGETFADKVTLLSVKISYVAKR